MGESNKAVRDMVGKILNDIADGIETGEFGKKVKVGITTVGNEHGVGNLVKGAEMAAKVAKGYDIVLIGPKDMDTELEIAEANNEDEAHKKMEELLDSGYIDACVTAHYPFPIGVATIGRVVTPAKGREMILASTTGSTASHRIVAMVKNTICGIAVAKAIGKEEPTVGLLNVDGARTVERTLRTLNENGYKINFAESMRADGGVVMRGNDLLAGTPDIMVQDTLTGNILMKVFSSYATGGSYEAAGFGYGPGVGGDGYDRVVLILSRASGSPVAAGALQFAGELALGNIKEVAKEEFAAARKAGLDGIIDSLMEADKPKAEEKVEAPPAEIVTGEISGIDVLDIDDAVIAVWKVGIYAEGGMGCTGPVVLVNEEKVEAATEAIKAAGYL